MMTKCLDRMSADLDLAHRIAKCAIDHYDNTIPSNGGKPQLGREWTVYAAIVACRNRSDGERGSVNDEPESWVVSCATGSKCTSIRSTVSSLPSPNKGYDATRSHGTNATRNRGKMRPQIDLDDESICKCYNGMILKDSHAETLARRGLLACLWGEIENYMQHMQAKLTTCNGKMPSMEDTAVMEDSEQNSQTHDLLEIRPSNLDANGSLSFQLKSNITLHLYVSDSPCGDATIYEIGKRTNQQPQSDENNKKNEDSKDTEINFTGAKIILAGDQDQHTRKNSFISSILTCSTGQSTNNDGNANQSTITLGREDIQQLGALRVKSSRSNIPSELRSTSMSCSDKLVRWGVFGMQGSILSMYIPEPICLSSICVSKDPRSVDGGTHGGQLDALERALSGRIENTLKSIPHAPSRNLIKPPSVAVVDNMFESSKSASENRYLEAQINEKKRSVEQTCSVPSKRSKTHEHGQAENKSSSSQSQKSTISCRPSQASKKESACGMSINWHQHSYQVNKSTKRNEKKATEITIGATGLKRGKKAKTPKNVLSSASRLCRFSFLQRCMRCTETEEPTIASSRCHTEEEVTKKKDIGTTPSSQTAEKEMSYMKYKQNRGRRFGTESFQGPLMGYIRSGKDDDFMIPKSNN